MKTTFYTYVYLDPSKPGRFTYNNFVTFLYEPFYVGKGTGNRFRCHISDARVGKKSHKNNKIRKIINKGYKMESFIMFLRTSMPEYVALYCSECFWINLIGRKSTKTGPLLNITAGGEGSSVPSKYAGVSYILRFGEERANEIKEKIKIARKDQMLSPETREKISAAMQNRVISEDHRVNLSQSLSGRVLSDETKKKISQSKKGKVSYYPTDEQRNHQSQLRLGRESALKGKSYEEIFGLEQAANLKTIRSNHKHTEETKSQMAIEAKRRSEKRTPEERAEIARKGWESRRNKQKP